MKTKEQKYKQLSFVLLDEKQNYQMSQEDHQEFTTPYRGAEEKDIQETALKAGEESHLQPPSRGEEAPPQEEEDQLENQLNQIEEEIRRTEERLGQIKAEKAKVDEESEEYANLEDERRARRKELIELDYSHKKAFQRYKRRNQELMKLKAEEEEQKLLQEQERIKQQREQESLERSRRLQAQLEEIKKEGEERREKILNLNKERQEGTTIKPTESVVKGASPPQESDLKADKEQGEAQEQPQESAEPKSLEQQEEEARHKARVAEIELELATDRLRRSRQIELQTELIRIRAEYPTYAWWRSFPYSYRLFSYPLDLPPLHPYLRYPYYLDYPLLNPYRRYYPLI